jgi:outer membrane protein OmpA-like peptidoglycan-associated protein
MRPSSALLAAAALAAATPGLSAEPAAQPGPPHGRVVRCLLLAPLENASNIPEAAEAANDGLVSFARGERDRLLSERELRAVFQDTALELSPGVPPSLAVSLAELLGADAVLYGTVEGHGGEPPSTLTVSLRVAIAGSRDLLVATSRPVAAREGERALVAVRRASADAGREAMAVLGGPLPATGCFDPELLRQVREAAFRASPGLAGPAPSGSPPPPRAAPPQAPSPPPPPRTALWTSRIGSRERFPIEGIAFDGRSPSLSWRAGLEDLARALLAVPAARVRLEGFVDSSGRTDEDRRLSMRMAEAVGERLVDLGVARERLSWSGRGADEPLYPNFTARGRAGNRRVEVVPLAETASLP